MRPGAALSCVITSSEAPWDRGKGGPPSIGNPYYGSIREVREDRVRRVLAKRGYILRKTPARSWLRQFYEPGYRIIEVARDLLVSDSGDCEYQDDIEQVGWFAFELLPAEQSA